MTFLENKDTKVLQSTAREERPYDRDDIEILESKHN